MIGKTLVIGFGHKARHGKDSAAAAVHEAYPKDTKVYSFASALKAYCRVEHGMTVKDAPLLQRVGLEKRAGNPDFWVELLAWQIRDEAPQVALIPDVRFENEARFCDAAIKVTRLVPTAGGLVPYVATDRPADHPSETALDTYTGWWTEIAAREGDLVKLRQDALAAYIDIRRAAAELAFIPDSQEAA